MKIEDSKTIEHIESLPVVDLGLDYSCDFYAYEINTEHHLWGVVSIADAPRTLVSVFGWLERHQCWISVQLENTVLAVIKKAGI